MLADNRYGDNSMLSPLRSIINPERSPASIKTNCQPVAKSKWFDTSAESAKLDRAFSISTSGSGELKENHWICTKCRQATTDEKHPFGKIKTVTFYCCDECWKQHKLQTLLGMIFRQIQFHLGFTTLWIPSPDGVFLRDRKDNYGEWVAIVILLVVTVSLLAAKSSHGGIAN
jgi:hypothetical protein